jgi:hypothetical protein
MGYELDGQENGVQFLAGIRDFFSLYTASRVAVGPT